ncbi:MAG: DUF4405 domain-containing protein [Candidatus Korarchaeota archaeon]|nr:DUF4405 domain-containing protein [Candidatus Korarchaeota archaeon]
MGAVYEVRRAVALIILVAGVITAFTGMIMTIAPGYMKDMALFGVPRFGRELHKYAAFILAGASFVHIYLNWSSIKRYLGLS